MLKLPLLSTCRCGHDRSAHEHYRAGTDCGLCDCVRFVPRVPRVPFLGRAGERRDQRPGGSGGAGG